MKTENSILMKQARESLRGKWLFAIGAIGASFIILILTTKIPKIGSFLNFIIQGPMALGLVIFCLSFSRNQNPQFKQIFDGFKRFKTTFVAQLLITVFTILWGLLLIIPGIIAGISYSMTFYIIADDPNIGAREAIKKSKKMMMGNKWKLFGMGLRFAGWILLSILTLGIGLLWVVPYAQIATTKFYDDLKNHEVVV
jgi:uncharacterized membrane protein